MSSDRRDDLDEHKMLLADIERQETHVVKCKKADCRWRDRGG